MTKGTAPPNTVSFDQTTNRINSAWYQHDANGNMTAMPGANNLTYDIDNRLLSANSNGSWEQYAYLADNKRVWKQTNQNGNLVEQYYLYGVGGERIATYTVNQQLLNEGTLFLAANQNTIDVYFGGRVIWQNGKAVLRDRLGSVMARSGDYTGLERHDYFPYGEERTPTVGDRNKYGTYHRDQTGLDYADQRYYNSTIGRFLSADPYEASGGANEPASWGRGVYVHGDPVNFNDPIGLYEKQADKDSVKEWLRQHFGMPIYDTVNVQDPNESEREEKAQSIQRFLRSMACNATPAGRVTTVSVGAGILGTAQVTVDFVLNYNTGNVSAFFGAGVQLGINPAGASASVAFGLVYGLGANTGDFVNLSRSFSAGTPQGVGVSYADSSSDGFKSDGSITSIAIQFGYGLNSLKWVGDAFRWTRGFSGGLGPQGNAPVEFGLGSFADPNGLPTPIGAAMSAGVPFLPSADAMLYKMRQDCIAEGLIRF